MDLVTKTVDVCQNVRRMFLECWQLEPFIGHDLGAVCKIKNELYLGSCFPIYQSASSSSSHNQVRRGSDH